MKSYVAFNDRTKADCFAIVYRVQARDLSHAKEKLSALYGDAWQSLEVASYADYCADRDLVLEQMHCAPWQRSMSRNTSPKAFGV